MSPKQKTPTPLPSVEKEDRQSPKRKPTLAELMQRRVATENPSPQWMDDAALSRFHLKFEVSESGCWEWTKGLTVDGYGGFWLNRTNRHAHRVSFETFNGVIEREFYACHYCDNPKCVNPDHIFKGTQKENFQDCMRKGRMTGPNRPWLSEDQVIEIINYINSGKSANDIAKMFEIERHNVYQIRLGLSWKHLHHRIKQRIFPIARAGWNRRK
jgi:hypothetical protein